MEKDLFPKKKDFRSSNRYYESLEEFHSGNNLHTGHIDADGIRILDEAASTLEQTALKIRSIVANSGIIPKPSETISPSIEQSQHINVSPFLN